MQKRIYALARLQFNGSKLVTPILQEQNFP